MADEPDRLFERYRRGGDTEALGRVFDATAPRLLQIAVHLVGDLGAAEDLVQATFVTAIERAATFDSARSLEPWLTGILANHARYLKKAARREIDVTSLVERIEATPLQQALAAEWSSALAGALDSVPEPYRLVLIMRLQHGMEPAEIAHALQRSPGAVRVQLHRGREMLRKLLPAGLVASALFIAEPSRGLAGVKANVITHAAVAKSSVGALALVGGLLMSKKLVIAGAALLVALLAFLIVRSRALEPRELSAAVGSRATNLESIAEEPAAIAPIEAAPLTQRVEATPMTTANEAKTVKLHGRVVDSESDAGIANANVSLFAPHSARMSEVRHRWHDRLQTDWLGKVRPYGSWPHGSIWPLFASDPTDQACFDAENITVYEQPSGGISALTRALTNSSGEFEIVVPETLGFLVCNADGYAVRQQGLTPANVNSGNAEDVSITITMRATRPLAGYVVDENMNRIAKRIHLGLFGQMKKPAPTTRSNDFEGDMWPIETNSDGSFECALPAATVDVHSLDPALGVVKTGYLHDAGAKFVEPAWPEPRTDEPLVVVMRPVCSLVVRDRVTQEPIEDIHLRCVSRTTGAALRNGRFFAPSGRMPLVRVDGLAWSDPIEAEQNPCECTVWAEGYLPATKTLEDMVAPQVVEFDLEPGELPSISGRIHDAERNVGSASIALLRFNGATMWPPPDRAWGVQIAGTSSDAKGNFRVAAPAARYVLDIVNGNTEEIRVVELPATASIDVDLSIDTALVLVVHDSAGAACPDLPVILRGRDGRSVGLRTDPMGIALFSRLLAGTHQVQMWNDAAKKRSSPDQDLSVDLRTGEQKIIDIVIPISSPRFARVIVEGVTSLTGWRASSASAANTGWFDIDPNGRIPLDIRGQPALTIAASTHQEWTALLPKDAPDGYPIRILLGGPGYDGVLTSQSTGEPLKAIRVVAELLEDPTGANNIVAGMTDDEGRFQITGLNNGAYSLRFQDTRPKSETQFIYVHPANLPSLPLTHLALALPKSMAGGTFEGLETMTVTGMIHRATGSAQGLYGYMGSLIERSGYMLHLYTEFVVTPNGGYEVRVPVAPSFTVSLRGPGAVEALGEFTWKASGTGDRDVHDIDLP